MPETRNENGFVDSENHEEKIGSEESRVEEAVAKNDAAGESCNDETASRPGAEKDYEEESPHHGAALVMESRDWYRDRFRQVVIICMVAVAILTASLGVNLIQAVSRPKPVYFSVSDDFRIKSMKPLNEPVISESGLSNWVARTVTKTFSLDFVHWREQLMEVKPEYTEDCFKQLIKSLQDAGNLEMIKKRRLVLSAVVKNAPVVTAKGTVGGRMVWKMEFPISFAYESSERKVASQDLICTVMVRRVSVLKHPRGVRLAQIVLK